MSGRLVKWGGWRDSNPRQPEPQSGVLPLNYTHRAKQNYNIGTVIGPSTA